MVFTPHPYLRMHSPTAARARNATTHVHTYTHAAAQSTAYFRPRGILVRQQTVPRGSSATRRRQWAPLCAAILPIQPTSCAMNSHRVRHVVHMLVAFDLFGAASGRARFFLWTAASAASASAVGTCRCRPWCACHTMGAHKQYQV